MANLKGSDNPFPSILIEEATEPAAPAAGHQRLYVDSTTHALMIVNSSGTESPVAGASGAVATDAIWDAAGDLAVGSGANTAAKLSIGAVGGHLSRINGAVAWDSGTSNPGSAVAGDRYWRSDLGQIIYYDGTRWLTEQMYEYTVTNTAGIAASADVGFFPPLGGADIWMVDFRWQYNITPTHTGTHYWQMLLKKYEASGATATTITTLTSDQSSTIWTNPAPTAVGALLGTTIDLIWFQTVKVSSPSNLLFGVTMRYRRVIT